MQRQSAHTPSAVCRRMALVSADAHLPTHGGLTPAALGCVDDSRRTLRHSPRTARVMRTTAGLRPPLLLLCVRASQKAVFHRRTIVLQSRAGGVSPPWNVPSARELEAPKFVALELQTGFTNPRRAHARRSCYCAFVHRKRRYFTGERSCSNTRARGVSPPWPAIVRDTTNRRNTIVAGNRIRTSDQLREPSAPRGANKRECNGNPHTHRRRSADEWRSCLPMRICPPTAGSRPPLLVLCVSASQTSFFRRQTSAHQHKSGGRQPPRGRPSCETQRTGETQALLCNRIRTSDWEKADTQRQRLRRGPLRSKPPEVEPFHTPGESDRRVFTPYIPRQPRLRGPAIHLPKPLAALLHHIFGMAGVKATLRNWGGDYNGMLSRVP